MATLKQQALRALYPLLMTATKWAGKNISVLYNKSGEHATTSIYDLPVLLNNGTLVPLSTWKGKKLLLVNTASDCGYTAQYRALQQLQERFPHNLQVIGFPANDFKEQEQKSDAEIAQFCQVNFGITFPLATKSSVVKGPKQDPVFFWLTHREKNGWNDKVPTWNFSKYLVNEKGQLTHYFDPSIAPLSNTILQAIGT